ncbi:GNAT family N-acetyltransferase [Micromonospora sp. NPDC049559]|uniref:GNAT family N-acetyltransferase n=1 Tax=Micromonospora sp. NPDC049559 TaxID=3155923 RepID=UPI003432171C
MELHTTRLLLREFAPADHPPVHAFASDPRVTRFTDWGPNTPEETTTFLREVTHDARALPRTRFGLAVVERAEGLLVGSIELRVTSAAHRRGTLGYALAPSRWGRGYATEAAAALLRYGFDGLGLHKINATCDPDNLGSARVLAKIGMRPEGHLRDQVRTRDGWRDRLLFAALSTAGPTETVRPD